MLYQTHPHPLFFHFKRLSSSIHHLPSAISALSPLCSSHSSQVEKEMACVEVALKGSFRKEMTLKSNQQALLEDFSTVNGQSGVVSVEDFSVDDLLDFSVMGGAEEDDKEKEEEDKSCVSLSSPQQQLITKESSNHDENLAFKDDFGSNELSVPVDDVANLEWLSHFVEDSFSEYSLPFPAGNLTAKPKNTPEETTIEPPSAKLPCFATPVPAKARTKRTRTGGRRWSFGSTTESSSSSSSSSSSTSSLPSTSWLIYTTPTHIVDSFNSLTRRPAKKQKRRIVSETGGGGGTQPPRRCSHCGVQKTPQWRAGPLGAKTLCNACGVRFKSGRLLPEYRPACSPTFSSEMHSNHHRKVLEMRKKNETVGPEPGLTPAVAIF